MRQKVVVAMSGGVDSAVAAYLLKEEGYDVIGVTLRLAPESENGGSTPRTGRCCSIDDMVDARHVCEKIGIPFYAIDARDKFKSTVFDPFVTAYKNGITPIPCLACNHEVKFGDLFTTANKLKARLATGHYANIVDYKGKKTIAKPHDLDRDQTYYLYGTHGDYVEKILFPLGNLKKPKVREIASKIGLSVHDKKDSHEICFVPDGDHAKVVEKALNKKFNGEIVDENGKTLGHHNGVHRYTIGQRRGLGVATGDKLFVADIDAKNQKIVLAKRSSLACREIMVKDMNFLIPIDHWPEEITVKIRARSKEQRATITKVDLEKMQLSFKSLDDLYGVALGQAAVFYDGSTLLGGGIICGRLDGAFKRVASNTVAST